MELTARTLILDLISTLRRGAMPVAALVEAGGLFGFEENNVRVTLSKLHAAGRVERDERGSYRLGEAAAGLADALRGWRRLERECRTWRGEWVGAHLPRRGRGRERRLRERALAVLGFRELEAGLHVRPDNLVGGVDGVRERFAAIAGEAPLVLGLRDLDPEADARARGLWDVEALVGGYRALAASLEASLARLPGLSEEETRVETFLVGGRVVRRLVVDPRLPAPILDPAPRRELVRAMRAYDEVGRRAWAPFLAAHGVTRSQSSRSGRATHDVAAAVQGAS
jgi:phenylacetic acid degradation operon negative regulatory protein